ncbi:MAG: GNAT family N-acetyltransferase [Sphingobium sp.]
MPTLTPLAEMPDRDIEAILDAAFGTDRHLRTAYTIRIGLHWLPSFSYGLRDAAGRWLGLLQSWPVQLNGDDGVRTPLMMVGPVAVLPEDQGEGYGIMLMDQLVIDADRNSSVPLMMIGDPEYYGRFWAFSADATSGWRAPGPVDPRRLLMRPVRGHAILPALSGILGPQAD